MQKNRPTTLNGLFQAAVSELQRRHEPFAVAGGFAAALYRLEPRVTRDIDLAILAHPHGVKVAMAVMEALGLRSGIARKANLDGGPLFAIKRNNTEPCMVIGRPEGHVNGPGLDILLPALPWASHAVQRAQMNMINYGFGSVPVLTLEDVIVSKLYALQAKPLRAKDLDDLQSIYAAAHTIDNPYLAGQIQRLKIRIPKEAKPFLPDILFKMSKSGPGED